MGLSSSKTKTNSTSTSSPLDQYAPYITQGLTTAQGILNDNQGNMQNLSGKALDVANGFAPQQSTLAGIYGGNTQAAGTYSNLQNAQANDASIPALKSVIDNAYSNPGFDPLKGFTNPTVNPMSDQFYSDTLSGKYLNGNPYLDAIVQQGTDAATKGLNQRFAGSGMGEGMSTPYAQALGQSVADANNQLRYGAYRDELGRMGTIGGQSDAQYNAGQDRALTASNDLAGAYNTATGLKASAATAMGNQNTNDNNTALNAANGSLSSTLQALGLSGTLSQDQLAALQSAAGIPYTGVNQYANLVNGLTGKYGTNTTNSTQTQSGNIGQMLSGLAGSALGAFASGGLGGLGGGGGLGSIFGGSGGGTSMFNPGGTFGMGL
jgi:hypothetical protein